MDPNQTKKSDTAGDRCAEYEEYASRRDIVKRNGGEVWCAKRNREALVSVVERDGPQGQIRYVQWCSLIDLDECGQECMCQFAEEHP